MIKRVPANHGRGGAEDYEVRCDVADCAETLRVYSDRIQDAWYAAVDEGWANRTVTDDTPATARTESVDLCPRCAAWHQRGYGIQLVPPPEHPQTARPKELTSRG